MKALYEALRLVCEHAAVHGGDSAGGYRHLLETVDWAAPTRAPRPEKAPAVDRWFEAACGLGGDNPLGELGRVALAHAEDLEWISYYPEHADDPRMSVFRKGYAIARLVSPDGPLVAEDAALVLTLQAPDCFYPQHVHKQKEVYGVIGGTADWQWGGGPWKPQPPGTYIYHPSGVRHAMRTREEPMLCLACWLGQLGNPVVVVWE